MVALPNSILILVPEPLQRDLVSLAVSRLGFPVITCSDGRFAEQALRKELPLVMIIDLIMPQENGVDWLKRIKEIPGAALVPALVLSSPGYPDMVNQAAEAGAKAFITKPVDTDLLVEKVIRLMAIAEDGVIR